MIQACSSKGIVFLRLMICTAVSCMLVFAPVTAKAGQELSGAVETAALDEPKPLPEAKLNLRVVSVVKGNEYALKVYNLTEGQTVVFKSDNEEIVSVNANGLITGLEYGTALVTAHIKEGNKTIVKLTCDVTVGVAAVHVALTQKEHTLAVDEKFVLKTILEPFNTVEEPKFFSTDPAVATVSAGGRVTAKSEGTVIIYVLIDHKSKYDFCVFTVVPALSGQEGTYGQDAAEGGSTDASNKNR